jgi:hypothetical protein
VASWNLGAGDLVVWRPDSFPDLILSLVCFTQEAAA